MITVSGRNITLQSGSPTLYDIGYGLSQMPRFAGQTRVKWSVLQHLLVCEHLAYHIGIEDNGVRNTVALYALLHDAHEAVTGDIPRPWKTESMKNHQAEIDRRMYKELGLLWPVKVVEQWVKKIDEAALLAEAYVVGNRFLNNEWNLTSDTLYINSVMFVLNAYGNLTPDEGGRVFERRVRDWLDFRKVSNGTKDFVQQMQSAQGSRSV